jgi:hypothetical protein
VSGHARILHTHSHGLCWGKQNITLIQFDRLWDPSKNNICIILHQWNPWNPSIPCYHRNKDKHGGIHSWTGDPMIKYEKITSHPGRPPALRTLPVVLDEAICKAKKDRSALVRDMEMDWSLIGVKCGDVALWNNALNAVDAVTGGVVANKPEMWWFAKELQWISMDPVRKCPRTTRFGNCSGEGN